MGDDWKPGDLALCVRDDWENDGERSDLVKDTPQISIGFLKPVAFVVIPSRDYPGYAHLLAADVYLSFDAAARYGYRADWFRKINPLTDEEREQAMREITAPEKVLADMQARIDRLREAGLLPVRENG